MPGKPRRLTSTAWVAGALAAALAATPLPAAAEPSAPPAPSRITVDLAADEGPVMRGANGALYGLSDDGVPSDAMLEPLKLTTVSQKAQGGAQHPNGDALTVAKPFFRNGGGEVYVMMQDIYAKWPYEDLGIDDYLPKVDKIAQEVEAAPNSDRFVYVPFNEPDWIWYGLNSPDPATYQAGRDRFFRDWKTVHRRIRAVDPGARIAGPNEAYYDSRLMPEFLAWTQKENVLPDVTTWHELSPDSLKDFQGHYDHYRALEKRLGITPRPVNINEYANRRDLSVPGQLIQWMSMFERNKVFADQAYWDAAGNLDGNVVHTNIPNGGWWLFRWYAGLTGRTVDVAPPRADTVDTLQGLASLDTARRQAQVLLGGASGDTDVVVRHADPAVFGTTVTATVAEAAWSGYEGAHPAPRTLTRTKLPVAADGTVTVPVRGMKSMSAYRVVLTPGGSGVPEQPAASWTASYEAEKARITDGQVYAQGTVQNANGYAASGTQDVGSLELPSSKVDFTATVPRTGRYDLAVLYGNESGAPSSHTLLVDGAKRTTVRYPSTQNWAYRARKDLTVDLTAGTHTLTLARDTGEATLDRIDLIEHLTPAATYEATLADISGRPAFDYTRTGATGTGTLTLRGGDRAVFDVYAPRDGYYTVRPSAGRAVGLSLHGASVTVSHNTSVRLFLVQGNNRIAVTAASDVEVPLRSLDVSGTGDTGGVAVHEGASAALTGTARLVNSPHAGEGSYVGWLGNGAGNTATFTVRAAEAGRHLLTLHYSNNDRRDNGHAYNTDIMSRTADLTVGGGSARRVTFKNTWSWDDFWTIGVPVDLKPGTNTVTLTNPDGYAPNIDRLDAAPVVSR